MICLVCILISFFACIAAAVCGMVLIMVISVYNIMRFFGRI